MRVCGGERRASAADGRLSALRKTSHLLRAFAEHAGRTSYYALDLEHRELVRTLAGITAPDGELAAALNGRVDVRGLCGTYEDGIRFVNDGALAALDAKLQEAPEQPWERGRNGLCLPQAPRARHASSSPMSTASSDSPTASASSGYTTPPSDDQAPSAARPLHILFLGSSIGNFPRDDAAAFLKSLPLRPGSGDTLLLGLDGRNDKELVERAYHDSDGHTERFIMNGLKAAGRILGTDELCADKWAYESTYNDQLGADSVSRLSR